MPTFVVERELEGAGWLSADQLQGIAQRSCLVLADMEQTIEWVESYITEDKFYCVYNAPDLATLTEHARRVGLPISCVCEVCRKVNPASFNMMPEFGEAE